MFPKYLNSFTTSNLSSSIITLHCDIPFLSNTITLLLSTFIFIFLLLHTSAKHCTSSRKSHSDSANSTASSAYNKCDTFHLLFLHKSSTPLFITWLFISFIAPSINTLNNHVDIIHPCLTPVFTSNHSLVLLSTLTHALLPS